MSHWNTYQNLFGQTIDNTQKYEKSIKSMLNDIDKSEDPCHHHKQITFLQNFLRTKSDECYSIRGWIPLVYNYKWQTLRRANYFERLAAATYTQCLQYTAKQSEKLKLKHQLDLKILEEQTQRLIAKEKQITQRQRIKAMQAYTETKSGVKPEHFRQ